MQTYYDNVYAGGMVVQTSMQCIEDNFAALKSTFSGAAAPNNPAGGMLWLDTTNNLLKQRDVANAAWITLWDMTKTTWLAMLLANLGSAINGDRGDITVSGSGLVWTISAESISVSMMAEYAAGDYPICSCWGPASTESPTFEKVLEIYVARGGTVRVKFSGKRTADTSCHARVYLNGVAAGTTRTLGINYATWSEDFNVNAHDRVQIYLQGALDLPSYITNFLICSASQEQTSVSFCAVAEGVSEGGGD